MRLRRLSEAECYARCYGWRSDERTSITLLPSRRPRRPPTGEQLRELFEQRLVTRTLEDEAA